MSRCFLCILTLLFSLSGLALGDFIENERSSLAPKAGGFNPKFWNKSTNFNGNKVFQRDDLINLGLVDKKSGLTNLQLMQKGRAPIGPDGRPVNLHHMTQQHNGSIAEVTQTFHQQNSKIIHINPSSTPSGINRSQFNKWRGDYWKNRATGFE